MERLSCQTPAMAIKEIWVYLLAYNLIRLMMAQAAWLAHRLPRQLSFKHTVRESGSPGLTTPTESTTTSSMACLSSSPNNTSVSAPAVSSPALSNDDLNPIRCLPYRARLHARSSENMVTRKSLSKCHSSPNPLIR